MKCEQRDAFIDGKMCGTEVLRWCSQLMLTPLAFRRQRLFFMEGLLAGDAPGSKVFSDALNRLQGVWLDAPLSARILTLTPCYVVGHQRSTGCPSS
jgi:hypothetical protein